MMNGELQYKDLNGRIWRIQNHTSFKWTAETLDIGHTVHHHLSDLRLEMLLASIDREGFTTDDRSTQPISSAEIDAASRESDPESITEIRAIAAEVNGVEFESEDPLKRFEERDE